MYQQQAGAPIYEGGGRAQKGEAKVELSIGLHSAHPGHVVNKSDDTAVSGQPSD